MVILFAVLLAIIAFGLVKVEMGKRKNTPIPAIGAVPPRKRK